MPFANRGPVCTLELKTLTQCIFLFILESDLWETCHCPYCCRLCLATAVYSAVTKQRMVLVQSASALRTATGGVLFDRCPLLALYWRDYQSGMSMYEENHLLNCSRINVYYNCTALLYWNATLNWKFKIPLNVSSYLTLDQIYRETRPPGVFLRHHFITQRRKYNSK
jgi:hypothetical protein